MATYKKRGGKPKTKVEPVDFEDDDSTTAEVFSTLDEGANKTEQWVVKNQKAIFVVIGIIALLVLAYLAYDKFIEEPRELEASNEMYQAQNFFNEALGGAARKDSLYNLALEGGEGKYGFLDIIDNYSGTKAGNLAQYYAGMAYLNTNSYQQAIDYLEDFNSDGEELILAPLAKGGIGDAFMQLDQPEEALQYYEEAANIRTNEFTTPRFLLKAALTALQLNEKNRAAELLERIEQDYPNSPQAEEVPLYMGMANTAKE